MTLGIERKPGKLEKLGAYANIAILIVAILALFFSVDASYRAIDASNRANDLAGQGLTNTQFANNLTALAYNLTRLSFELQNVTSNFELYLLPYYVTATVGDLSTATPLNAFGEIETYGSLNLSIVVVTPHAAIINFTQKNILPPEINDTLFDWNFNITVNKNAPWINSSNFFTPTIAVLPYLPMNEVGGNQFFDYKPQAFVQPGVTLTNFVIPIHASIPLNQSLTGRMYGAHLGSISYEISMYDVQLRKTVALFNSTESILTNIYS